MNVYAMHVKVQTLENVHVKMHSKNSIDLVLILTTKFSIFHFKMFIHCQTVNVVDGEMLLITKVSRLHMAAYLCVASNGV